jgi:hypothetical protein
MTTKKPSRRPSQRPRPRPKRRRWNLLAKLATVAAIAGVLIAFLSWRSETRATDREHESRRAREARAEYKELDADVGRYVKGAKLVYRASYQQWKMTGRWPRGEDLKAYEAVIDAGSDVRRLQAGVSDRKLRKLLVALRADVGEMCATTSAKTAHRASHEMMDHWDDVSVRVALLRNEKARWLGMLG